MKDFQSVELDALGPRSVGALTQWIFSRSPDCPGIANWNLFDVPGSLSDWGLNRAASGVCKSFTVYAGGKRQ